MNVIVRMQPTYIMKRILHLVTVSEGSLFITLSRPHGEKVLVHGGINLCSGCNFLQCRITVLDEVKV